MKAKPTIRNRYVLLGDLGFILICAIGSYVLRLELDGSFGNYLPSLYWLAGVSFIIKPLVYYYFGLYRRLWLYASMQELKLIITAVTTASILVSILIIAIFTIGVFRGFPRSVLIIDWLLSMMAVGGLRFALRLLAENKIVTAVQTRFGKTRQVLIVGAGDAGALVVRELEKNPQLNFTPVGFLDDDSSKYNQQIYNVPVIGTLQDLPKVLDNQHIDEVIISIPSAPGNIVRLIADVCRLKKVSFRTMPGIYELLGGKVSISRLRDVDISDLLRREPARLMDEEVGATIGGKVIMITGAGGSIGQELCRQIARWGPSELILLGHGENSIFETVLELHESFPSLLIKPLICDVRHISRLKTIFNRHRPNIIFHTAAHKHVPLMEINVEEAVTNNILGTKNVVEVALEEDIERLVLISTDKAIRPINVMGATKRIAESIVLDAAKRSGRAFSIVRFGNVLGSRGSVVPLFKRQIAQGGPVTITHPDMKRYFMTIPEAVNLVLQAASMGQQIRVLDLAEDLIRLSGLEPGKDIDIVFTGIRPGEKLMEDLWEEGEVFQKTSHPDIFQMEIEEDRLVGESLIHVVNELIHLANEGDPSAIKNILDDVIPNAAIRVTPPPEITSIS